MLRSGLKRSIYRSKGKEGQGIKHEDMYKESVNHLALLAIIGHFSIGRFTYE